MACRLPMADERRPEKGTLESVEMRSKKTNRSHTHRQKMRSNGCMSSLVNSLSVCAVGSDMSRVTVRDGYRLG